MNTQHCGTMGDHDKHTHRARLKRLVQVCVCDNNPCTCIDLLEFETRHKVELECSGKVVTEGAPRHLPVEVAL